MRGRAPCPTTKQQLVAAPAATGICLLLCSQVCMRLYANPTHTTAWSFVFLNSCALKFGLASLCLSFMSNTSERLSAQRSHVQGRSELHEQCCVCLSAAVDLQLNMCLVPCAVNHHHPIRVLSLA